MPLDVGGSSDMTVTVDGYTPREGEEPMAYYNQVGPAYFETMGIPLVKGRGDHVARRGRASPPIAVINETMARRYWPGRDPIGATIRFGRGPVTIVGVARDGKYSRLSEEPRNYVYLPALQNYRPDLLLHVKTDADPALVLPAVRAAVRDARSEPAAVRRADDRGAHAHQHLHRAHGGVDARPVRRARACCSPASDSMA